MRLLLISFVAVIFAGCGPKVLPTRYNLGFEYTSGGTAPAQWELPDSVLTGYTAVSDRHPCREGRASLRLEQTDSRKMAGAEFYQTLPAERVAGREVELTGWVCTQEVMQGFADLYLADEGLVDSDSLMRNDSCRGVRGTSGWMRVSVKKRVGDSGVEFGGFLKGGGRVWFDALTLRIDGELVPDSVVPAPKVRLTREDRVELGKYVYPLKSCLPSERDSSDLRVLDRMIGDSRVVALGENSHGSREVFQLKGRLVRYLAEQLGFGVFSMEANMASVYPVNAYIDGRSDRAFPAAAYMGGTQEMLELVEWMRSAFCRGVPVTCFGVDMQYWAGSVAALKAGLGDGEQSGALLARIADGLEQVISYKYVKPEVNAVVAAGIESDLKRLEVQVERSAADVREKAWMRQNIRLIRQYLGQGTLAWRDCCMADNLSWVLDQYPSSRVILWAHNGHIRPAAGMMGRYLKERLGENYTTIGTTFYEGSYTGLRQVGEPFSDIEAQTARPGTLEYVLDQLDEPLFILDLKKMQMDDTPALAWIDALNFRHAGVLRLGNEFWDREVSAAFDYLIFIRTSSPCKPLQSD